MRQGSSIGNFLNQTLGSIFLGIFIAAFLHLYWEGLSLFNQSMPNKWLCIIGISAGASIIISSLVTHTYTVSFRAITGLAILMPLNMGLISFGYPLDYPLFFGAGQITLIQLLHLINSVFMVAVILMSIIHFSEIKKV